MRRGVAKLHTGFPTIVNSAYYSNLYFDCSVAKEIYHKVVKRMSKSSKTLFKWQWYDAQAINKNFRIFPKSRRLVRSKTKKQTNKQNYHRVMVNGFQPISARVASCSFFLLFYKTIYKATCSPPADYVLVREASIE